MRKTPLKRVSDKQLEKNEQWRRIRLIKIVETHNTCEWCGGKGQNNEFYQLDPHHKLSKGRGGKNTLENCALLHRVCHDKVQLLNIDLFEFPNKKTWEAKNGS